eukprot:Gregarina_sp_Pseudo_9__6010@NODE_9_length_6712_cov_72_400270_g7_i0_p1_GENE_NODE_9_length_6712_cov_72_400270_g7_i0NODE_9_length_6712_cov_72_400270_g7_i0_p1_ORF_typecomplete_len1083_score336_41DUF2828/PF11443_8/3_3e78VWA_CoxE/PF05762_14/18VWA_CoxE/PF05762_14/0_0004VWA_3/PF13768_6/0_00055VWA_2/PF13519_6/1_8e04VWA_2/PF13519_6/0_043_NODE_9_length_6712_cov_72_400270_g7_i033896637
MLYLVFTDDYQVKLEERTSPRLAPKSPEQVCVTLGLNARWKLLLRPKSDAQIRIVTKRFAHTPVEDESLLDLHTIAFALIYLNKRVEAQEQGGDPRLAFIAAESKKLYTWEHARHCPIGFAAEFLESLTPSLKVGDAQFSLLQRAWLLPMLHLVSQGRPGHLAQGPFLFPFYRALRSAVPFFNVGAVTEAAARLAMARARRDATAVRRDATAVLATDSRIVALMKETALKKPWDSARDAVALADQMHKLFPCLHEYLDALLHERPAYKPWDSASKTELKAVHKKHLWVGGEKIEDPSMKPSNKLGLSFAQAIKKSEKMHIRLELLPETSRKRGCPEHFDACPKQVPDSANWGHFVKAMQLPELGVSEAEIERVLAAARDSKLWDADSSFTKVERQALFQTIALPLPVSQLQRVIVLGDFAVDKQSMGGDNAEDDAKENVLTLTTNKAVAWEHTGSKLLNFFTSGKSEEAYKHLDACWKVDPVSTLKVIFYHRSIMQGKGNNKYFYQCERWLFKNHFRTFLWNLPHLAFRIDAGEHNSDPKMTHPMGYWKDLLEMLMLWTKEAEAPVIGEHKKHFPRFAKKIKTGNGKASSAAPQLASDTAERQNAWSLPHSAKRDPSAWKELLAKVYTVDANLQQFHEAVAFLFAVQLKRDLAILERYETETETVSRNALRACVSLAGKWAPTPNRSHDRSTFISTSIARLLYPELPVSTPEDLEQLRWTYRSACLVPLRKLLCIPEHKIALQQYEGLSLRSMPSRALDRYSDLIAFFAPQVVEKSRKQKSELNASHLDPAKLIAQLVELKNVAESRRTLTESHGRPKFEYCSAAISDLACAKWTAFIDSLRDVPNLDKCVSLCDVSGSMCNSSQSIMWAMAYSLAISELASGPYRGKIITFESHPRFVEDDTSQSIVLRAQKLRSAPWGGSTNFKGAMDLILELAVSQRLPPEEMAALTLFVFSDMQFNHAFGVNTATLYENIGAEYEKLGYATMPRVVFWNLTGAATQPASAKTPNTVLLQGVGAGILRSFMVGEAIAEAKEESDDESGSDESGSDESEEEENSKNKRTPEDTMKDVLAMPCFERLSVID